MPNSSRTPLSFSKTCRTSASGWTTASSCVGVRPTTGSNQGQSDRGRDSRRARQRGVHLADVPRLRSSRSAESTSGVCVSARRLPRIGVPSRYERGRQTTSGGQQDRVAILRRSTSPAALVRGERACLGNRQAMTRHGTGVLVTAPRDTGRRPGDPRQTTPSAYSSETSSQSEPSLVGSPTVHGG